ncbi:hypothetical protein DFJ74DRAFT_648299 [Hyaloraphidium curvatum]|nr:hypothetical protein DFJ74DRAFT_648299 [Hyaloraphidium curvatum]
MTWALNSLIALSAREGPQPPLHHVPPLQDSVVNLLESKLESLWDRVSVTGTGIDGQSPVREDGLLIAKATGLLPSDSVFADRELALGSLHVLYNFSWAETNADTLARDPTILSAVELALRLGKADRDLFWEVHQYALDLLDNIANTVIIDSRDNHLVYSLCKSLQELDRREVVSAIRSLLRLCHRDQNSKIVLPLANTDEVVERLTSLLLVRAQDPELAYYVVELLNRIAQGGYGGAKRILDCGRSSVIRELVHLLRDTANRLLGDPLNPTAPYVPPSQLAEKLKTNASQPDLQSPARPFVPSGAAPPGAVEGQGQVADVQSVAAEWIANHLEKGPEPLPVARVYAAYAQFCARRGINPVAQHDLVDRVVKHFNTSAGGDPTFGLVIHGIRLKPPEQAAEAPPSTTVAAPVDDPMAVDDPSKAAVKDQAQGGEATGPTPAPLAGASPGLVETMTVGGLLSVRDDAAVSTSQDVNRCQWRGCGHAAEDRQALRAHVMSSHVGPSSEPFACHWKTCSRYPVERPATDRRALVAHVKTHDPWMDVKAPAAASEPGSAPPAAPAQAPAPAQPPPNPGAKPPQLAILCASLLAALAAQDSEHHATILEEPVLSVLALSGQLSQQIGAIMAASMEA